MRFEDVPWEAAACRGIATELFYLDNVDAHAMTPTLRRVCGACPILEECREYSVWHETTGFWGGLTGHERSRLRAQWRRKRNTTVRSVA